ncbi:hypothetical protein OROGR_003162 [Orobanche gracilis]
MRSTRSPSAAVCHHPQLPPGFRFHPTDEELVVNYLQKQAASAPLPAAIIAEIDLYKYDPWELPSKASFGEQEWYFFSPRERKYPNGERPNRAAPSGYWKATGTDKPIRTGNGTQKIGVKKALVFYGGKPPKGIKTNWIMHEYRLVHNSKPHGINPIKKSSSRLDDWVLCRIFKKSSSSNQPIEGNPIPVHDWNPHSGVMSHGNGSEITGPTNPTSASPLAPMFSSNHQWEADDDGSVNPGSSSSDKNPCFISLLNDHHHQYHQTMFNQNSTFVNYSQGGEEDGILNQSYQLFNSHLQ